MTPLVLHAGSLKLEELSDGVDLLWTLYAHREPLASLLSHTMCCLSREVVRPTLRGEVHVFCCFYPLILAPSAASLLSGRAGA